MSEKNRSRKERDLSQTVNDKKRLKREAAERQKARDAQKGNGKND